MPGLESDFEEWQTQEVNVARGEDEGDIDLNILMHILISPFLSKHTRFCG